MRKLWVILVLFITLGLRLMFLSDCLFHHDSVQLAMAVEETIKTNVLQPTVSQRYGLVLINTAFYLPGKFLFGLTTDKILNLTSALIATASVFVLYLLAKKITKNNKTAILSALFFSLSPLYLNTSVYSESHIFSTFFLLLTAYAYFSYLENKSIMQRVICAAAFVAAISIRNTSAYFLVPFVAHSLIQSKKDWVKRSLPLLIGFVTSLPILLPTMIYETAANPIPINNAQSMISLSLMAVSTLISTLSFLGIVLIAYYLFSIKRKEDLFLGIWIIPFFIAMSLVQTSTARFFIPILAMCFIFISKSILKLSRKWKVLSVISILVIITLFLSSSIPIIKFRHDYCAPKEYALFIKQNVKKNSIILANDESIFQRYYANLSSYGFPIDGSKQEVTKALIKINSLLENNTHIYTTDNTLYLSKENSTLKNLETNFILIPLGTAINEDYHHAELSLAIRNETLYEITLNETKSLDEFRVYYALATS